MERKARNCPPRLQRKYRDLRAGSGESLRLGLLQAVSSEQAPSDPIGPRPGAGSRSGGANSGGQWGRVLPLLAEEKRKSYRNRLSARPSAAGRYAIGDHQLFPSPNGIQALYRSEER